MSLQESDPANNRGTSDRRYQIIDLAVRIRCSDPSVSSRLSHLLGGFGAEGDVSASPDCVFSLSGRREGEPLTLRRNGELLAMAESWEPLIASLMAEVNTLAVAEMRCFAAHAGAVADQEGVVAFPAESGGGKSTFTAACLLAGFDYVSDEALCLDLEDGRVLPYPKPISLNPWSLGALGLTPSPGSQEETFVTAEDLGAVPVTGKLPLKHVLLMERTAGEPELTELSRSEVVASLLRASFNHYKKPEESFRMVTNIARSCQAWRIRFDDPKKAALMIREQLGRSSQL